MIRVQIALEVGIGEGWDEWGLIYHFFLGAKLEVRSEQMRERNETTRSFDMKMSCLLSASPFVQSDPLSPMV